MLGQRNFMVRPTMNRAQKKIDEKCKKKEKI